MAPKGESRQNLIEMLQKKASQFKAFASEKQTGWGKQKEEKPGKATEKPKLPTRQLFGVDISEALAASNEMLKCDECIPRLVYRCIEYIESKGFRYLILAYDEVGIYRLSGGIQSIRETRESFMMTGDCNMNEKFLDPNSAASLLKAFVRECKL